MAKRTPAPQIGHNQRGTPFSTHDLWKPPDATSSVPERLPLNSGEESSFIHGPHTKGSRCGAYMRNIIFFISLFFWSPPNELLIPECQATLVFNKSPSVLTPTSRAPLDGTPAVPQLRAQLDRGPILEGAVPSRKEVRGPRISSFFSGVVGGFPGLSRTTIKGPGKDGEEEEESLVEEEEYDGTEGVPAPMGESQVTGGPTLGHSNHPVFHQSEPCLLDIMQ
ncbi:hypothetical protein O181_010591 [Austropuccinia psidii MF-1]|uniref:Uncharacterized protein n=1 Tax=Austropuccinia psidii MF-1 TaxID=1389203 RepID=A0A9Q3GKJ8_9BASI|nr:hypothetical protein [Austropuccinia psidii MF-1]